MVWSLTSCVTSGKLIYLLNLNTVTKKMGMTQY